CVTAIVLSYSKKVNVAETEVEMSLPAESTPVVEETALPPVVEAKPAVIRRPVVAAPKAPAKKVVEIPFDLPAKVKSQEPEQLDPQIDEKEMVQVAAVPTEQQEQAEGPTTDVDESQTEATAEASEAKDPSPVTAVKAGTSEESAVS